VGLILGQSNRVITSPTARYLCESSWRSSPPTLHPHKTNVAEMRTHLRNKVSISAFKIWEDIYWHWLYVRMQVHVAIASLFSHNITIVLRFDPALLEDCFAILELRWSCKSVRSTVCEFINRRTLMRWLRYLATTQSGSPVTPRLVLIIKNTWSLDTWSFDLKTREVSILKHVKSWS